MILFINKVHRTPWDLGHIIIGFFSPALGNIIMFIARPLYLIWFPMVGLRLYKLRLTED